MAKILIGYPGIQADELKIISLTLERLLRNLPRLGGVGRSMYLPAEWGPRTREIALLGDSATTNWRSGLSHARKGFSEDQDERL